MTYDWDEGNLAHIGRHGVTAAEVEQALEGKLLHGPADVRGGEMRLNVVAPTATRRLLAITFTVRGKRLRIVTARVASRKERRIYAEYEKRESASS